MPEINVQHQCAALAGLVEAESFGNPIGPLPMQTDLGFFSAGNLVAGTWECEKGTLELDLDLTEFCHLLKGHWRFTSESGTVTEVRAETAGYSPEAGKALPRCWSRCARST